jgi:hypothetical protein
MLVIPVFIISQCMRVCVCVPSNSTLDIKYVHRPPPLNGLHCKLLSNPSPVKNNFNMVLQLHVFMGF